MPPAPQTRFITISDLLLQQRIAGSDSCALITCVEVHDLLLSASTVHTTFREPSPPSSHRSRSRSSSPDTVQGIESCVTGPGYTNSSFSTMTISFSSLTTTVLVPHAPDDTLCLATLSTVELAPFRAPAMPRSCKAALGVLTQFSVRDLVADLLFESEQHSFRTDVASVHAQMAPSTIVALHNIVRVLYMLGGDSGSN